MVFAVKEFNDASRFNIERPENKIAANMAEIWCATGYISSSMKSGDLMLMATLWFSGSINAMTSSDLTLDNQKQDGSQYGGNMALKCL